MAWLEQRQDTFHIALRIGNRRLKRSLRTGNRKEAEAVVDRVDRRLRMLEQGDIHLPEKTDLLTFLLSDGKCVRPLQLPDALPLSELFDSYESNLPEGAIESNTTYTIHIHLNHFLRILGRRFSSREITMPDLQRYVNTRSREAGRRGRTVSSTTIRKEIASLSGVWSWANVAGMVDSPLPKAGIRFPKLNEKPPFRTKDQIERQIARGGLSETEQEELWDCLFLTREEIDQVLRIVKERARHAFVYPMVVMAAHTGARRSELTRSQTDDFDFVSNTVVIRERKRVRGTKTTRSVPLSPMLRTVMQGLVADVPIQLTFFHSGQPLTVKSASHHFKQTLAGTDWEKIRGWHVFRHSFISNCAAQGIDQRIIDAWVGHQTDEMRRRYTHLFPDSEQKAIRSVSSPSDWILLSSSCEIIHSREFPRPQSRFSALTRPSRHHSRTVKSDLRRSSATSAVE